MSGRLVRGGRVRAAAVVAAAALCAAGGSAAPGAAVERGPGSRAGTGLPGFGAVVADPAGERVFVSGGGDGQAVAAVPLDGPVPGEPVLVEGQQGAHGLALSTDGSTLFAALSTGDAVSAIDTDTLEETARYPFPAHSCPTHLAHTGGVLWIGYGCEAWEGAIARLDTTAEKPAVELDRQGAHDGEPITFERAPLVASAGDGEGGTVAASQPGISPTSVVTYWVDDGRLKLLSDGPVRRGGSNLVDLALTPSGDRVLLATGSEDRVRGFGAERLEDRGAWFTADPPVALAPSPDGESLAAGVRVGGVDAHEVAVYDLPATAPRASVDLPMNEVVADRGLLWWPSPDTLGRDRLVLVTQEHATAEPKVTLEELN